MLMTDSCAALPLGVRFVLRFGSDPYLQNGRHRVRYGILLHAVKNYFVKIQKRY